MRARRIFKFSARLPEWRHWPALSTSNHPSCCLIFDLDTSKSCLLDSSLLYIINKVLFFWFSGVGEYILTSASATDLFPLSFKSVYKFKCFFPQKTSVLQTTNIISPIWPMSLKLIKETERKSWRVESETQISPTRCVFWLLLLWQIGIHFLRDSISESQKFDPKSAQQIWPHQKCTTPFVKWVSE